MSMYGGLIYGSRQSIQKLDVDREQWKIFSFLVV
jgi:hypothetical protein